LLEDGAFQAHFEVEREGFRRRAVAALGWLAAHAGRRGDAAAEGAWLAKAIALAPCDEHLYVHQMRHHLAAGRPERVRQAYWDARKALKQRLGLAPSDALEQAFRELAGG
jgi:DNA-binding SARP family transcriptional activator